MLIADCAELAATEAKYDGIDVTFSPMVDLVRDARWGRVMESGGEDPYWVQFLYRTVIGNNHAVETPFFSEHIDHDFFMP